MKSNRALVRRLAPARRRAQIIEAARQIIVHGGLERATVRAVAAACGVSVGTVSYHFPNLDALLVEVLRTASRRFTDEVIDQATSDTPAGERLWLLLDHALPDDDEAVAVWTLWLDYWRRAVRDHSLAVLQAERYTAMRTLVARVIEDGIRRREFDSEVEPASAALELVAVLDGVGLEVVIGDSAMTLDRARAILRGWVEVRLRAGAASDKVSA